MSLCPLEYRYGSDEMRKLFSRENILKTMARVEGALLWGLERAGIAPPGSYDRFTECSTPIDVTRIEELEKATGHELMALAMALEEACPSLASYIHLGATSNDIIDTTWALLIKDGLQVIVKRLIALLDGLVDLAYRHKNLVMIGRTHGQHALPITLGFKLMNYVYEYSRSLERILDMHGRVVRGKISGAVGTMAAWRGRGLIVEEQTLKKLGLDPHVISTQVAPRDGFAELASTFAILGSQLDRLALEIRELMRPEIGELAESARGRVGSSTMPHKQNPILSERVSGLAKVLRSISLASLENVPLWHERDLSNSSSERICLPHMFLVLDQMLLDMTRIVESLVVFEDKMGENLKLLRGANMGEAVMVELALRGLPRSEAHRIVGEAARRSIVEKREFADVLMEYDIVAKYIDRRELEGILDIGGYLGSFDELMGRAKDYYIEVRGRASRLVSGRGGGFN